MSKVAGKIIVYKPTMAKQAAEMFNAFNELWPGGFGGNVPYTEQRVHDWLDKTSAIADLIAITDEGELCGYCGLYPHWRDENAAYISILGVTPKAKGKKFGKRLLLKSLELAEKNGITRVDLHTWAGNLDAVPLYKKVGLFWVPDTSVYMQDYIPGIKQNPIAKEWFKKYPDWYKDFVRELDQIPDKQITDNMELYNYKFQNGKDMLTAEIDRYGWGICSIKRVMGGKQFEIITRLESHDIFIGIPNKITIEILSDYDEGEVEVAFAEFKGLQWKTKIPKKIKLTKGKKAVLTGEFVLDKSAELFKDYDRACKSMKTTIKIGDKKYDFSISGKIQSPLILRYMQNSRFKLVPIGKEVGIPLDIINKTHESISGHIKLTSDDNKKFSDKQSISLEKEQISGINVKTSIPDELKLNKVTIKAIPFLNYQNETIELPDFDFLLLANKRDLVELVENKDSKQITLITDKLSIRVSLEGGNTIITLFENGGSTRLNHNSGPPYGVSLDNTLLYNYQISKNDEYHILKVEAKSQQVKDLLIQKYFKVKPGLTEVEYWVEYTNLNKKKAIHASARTYPGRQGISLNPFTAKGRSFVHAKNNILENETFTNFLTSPVFPDDPKIYTETWIAEEGLLAKDYRGFIWKPDNVEKVKLNAGSLSRLDSKTQEIQPNQKYKPIHLWFTFGHNSLQAFRERYNQLIGNQELPYMQKLIGKDTIKVLNISLDEKQTFYTGETKELNLILNYNSSYPLKGTVSLKLPANWEGGFMTDDGLKKEIQIPEVEIFSSTEIPITVTAPKETINLVENIQVHLSGEYEIAFDNFIIVTKKGTIKIDNTVIDDKKLINIKNGEIKYSISADFGGNIIRLKDSKDRSFLMDSFPEIKPKFFLNKYIGGAQIHAFHQSANNPFSFIEKVETKEYTEDRWMGTLTKYVIKEDKEYLQGLEVEIKHLTLPNSNLIKVVITLINNSTRAIPWFSGILTDIAFQEQRDGIVCEVNSPSGLWLRNSVKQMFVADNPLTEPYSRVYKEDQSLALLIADNSKGTISTVDFGMMLLLLGLGINYSEPQSKTSATFAIVINQDRDLLPKIRHAI